MLINGDDGAKGAGTISVAYQSDRKNFGGTNSLLMKGSLNGFKILAT